MEGRNKTHSLVTGNITWGMLWFAVPMILGNLLQQFYNIADTLIVGFWEPMLWLLWGRPIR